MEGLGRDRAFRLVLLLSFISLLADITYEGARGIIGPYLAVMGAGAATVAFVVGFGEFIGYTPRLVSGALIDRTGRYWPLMFMGYGINLIAVPLLAFSGDWMTASMLIILERTGKALRAPARDSMLSYASVRMGRGWVFGIHEAISSVGAMLGPLVVALILLLHGGYAFAFALLALPAAFSMIALYITFKRYPVPREMEAAPIQGGRKLPRPFWIYMIATSLVAAGFLDFPVISYHLESTGMASIWISIMYAVANGVDALGALLLGRVYDSRGLSVLIALCAVSSLFVPLAFMGSFYLMVVGVILWGLGIGMQESLMRAVVADLTPADRRGTAYGLFSMAYGISWFLGTVLLGVLYERSIVSMVIISLFLQLVAVMILVVLRRSVVINHAQKSRDKEPFALK